MSDFSSHIPKYCSRVLKLVRDSGYEAYVVGGAVRDIARGFTPSDFDVAVSCPPAKTMEILSSAGIEYVDNAIKHGTVMAILDGHKLEMTTFRIDGSYTDVRRPDSVDFTSSINEDVKRRDFTMNALYLDDTGALKDFVGGLSDIENRIIRTVGDPDKRFEEDALRILRGLRFASSTGFAIEENTMAAMVKHAPLLKKISAERIQVEFNGIVTGEFGPDVILKSVPILKIIIPEIKYCENFLQYSKYHDRDVLTHISDVMRGLPLVDGKRDLNLSLAAFFHDISKPVCFYVDCSGGHMKRHPIYSEKIADRFLTDFKYPVSVHKDVCNLVRLHDTYAKTTKSDVHRFVADNSPEFCERLFVLQKSDILAHSPRGLSRMERLDEIRDVFAMLKEDGAVFDMSSLEVSGRDIIDRGVKAGPQVGEVLGKVWNAYLNGEVPNLKDKLLLFVDKCLAN